jgi:endonuclease III
VLADLHGDRDPLSSNAMNADGMDRPSSFPDVLDGLVYGLLCQATNENNAIRQVSSMDAQYGSWKNYDAIVTRGEAKLAETLRCGGLHVRKAKLLTSLLRQVEAKNENYTLNYLHKMSDEDAMQELLSYSGIGPKTASCVLALTLQRQRFVVDTHIHRITGMLGWRPAGASPEQARAHLECRIPDEHKYALHLLFIAHGRECLQCRAGSKDKDCAVLKEIKESASQKDDGLTGERN